MRTIIPITVLLLFQGAFAADHFTNCNWVHNRHCPDYGFDQMCATDSITYNNRTSIPNTFVTLDVGTNYADILSQVTQPDYFATMCYFAQAYCHDTFLHITHAGPCVLVSGGESTPSSGHVTGTVTDATTKAPLYNGPDAVLDFFCIYLSHEVCGLEKDEVCGSDNFTYLNPCEFEKERCTHRDLHVMHFGHC